MSLVFDRLKVLFPHIHHYKKQAISASICLIVVSFLALPTPYLMKFIIDEVLLNKNLRLLNLPFSFFDKSQSGYVLSRIGEVEGLNFFFSDIMIRALIGVLEFIFSLVILVRLNWKLTLISLFILPPLFLVTRLYSNGIRKVSREVMEKAAVLSSHVQETLSGVDVVKVFSAEKREQARIHYFLEDYKRAGIR